MSTDMRAGNIVGEGKQSAPVSQVIPSGMDKFEELRERGDIFVDKSLFIKEFIQNDTTDDKVILTTYPRRSGKSMNMRMLQSFFRIEVDERGNPLPEDQKKYRKYFVGGEVELDSGDRKILHPLKISTNPKAMKLQGEIPVIYIDMKDIAGDSLDEIFDSVKICISKSFREHSNYLENSHNLTLSEKKKVQKYSDVELSESLSDTEVYNSIYLLSELLKKHFGKEVIILIDEYDATINKAYSYMSDDEFKKVVEFFRRIYGAALKNNENLRKALVTGVTRIAKANIFSGLNNFGEYNITNVEFAPYYGFTQEEVDSLIAKYQMPEDMSGDIKSWYNGYKVRKYSIYNTWSIVKCISKYVSLNRSGQYDDDHDALKRDVLRSYWEASGNVDFIKDTFKNEIIKDDIDTLLSGGSIIFTLRESITSDDFLVLKKLTNLADNYEITQHTANIVFSYLMMGGYLTFADEYEEKFILPNHEIRDEFRNKMLEYYHAKYTVPTKRFTVVTNALGDVLSHVCDSGYEASIVNFRESFAALLKQLPAFKSMSDGNMLDDLKEGSIHGNEDVVHCLMSYIALQLCSAKRFGTEVCLGEGRADIAFIDRKLGVGAIIEIKYTRDSSAVERISKEGLEQIENKKYAEEMKKYYDVVLLGIGISEEKSVVVRDKVIRLGKDLEELERSRLLDFDLT